MINPFKNIEHLFKDDMKDEDFKRLIEKYADKVANEENRNISRSEYKRIKIMYDNKENKNGN